MASDLNYVAPLSVAEVVELFGRVSEPWWIAGGWAIDLFVGRQTREHEDIDVCVLRKDQAVVHETLACWDVFVADPPGKLRVWPMGEKLGAGKHDVWCRRGSEEPWSLWVMLNDSQGDQWIFRRNPSIRLPLGAVVRRTTAGVPYFAPEVQLLFKAKHMREKDLSDFEVALPLLDNSSRDWLRTRLAETYDAHPWTDRLARV